MTDKAFRQLTMRITLALIVCLASRILSANLSWYPGFLDNRPFTVRTTRFLCTGHPQYCRIDVCKLKLHRNGSSTISFRAIFPEPLQPVYGAMKIWYKTNVNVWRPLLGIDEWGDICQFLGATENKFTMMQVIYSHTLKQMMPNVSLTCPLQGSIEYKDFTYYDYMFPPFLPAGNYRNDITLLTPNNHTILALQYYGTVRAKGIFDLSMG
ncbi:uncharacterized protein LOC134212096 [Armigeres subalbatus]|uniref:uncharacterized protein LOC134212096 n=1 Tax=Armigeres subalbatus TaxID=124917 RepID=UPI002ED5DF19